MTVRKKTDDSGRTRFQVYVYDRAVKRSKYLGTFDSKRDAELAESEAKRRLRLGESIKPAPVREEIIFDKLAKQWRATLTHVRPATREDYRKAIQRVSPLIGRMRVSAITRQNIDMVIASLTERYAPCTVRKTLIVTKMVFRVAIDWGYIDAMPTGGSRLNLPKLKKRKFDPLSPEEVHRLIDAAPEYWKPWYIFMLTTGLRRSESFGLRVPDLDLDGGVVRVRQQLVKRKLVELKTDAADRRVPLPKQTVDALRQHLGARPDNELDLVFPSPEGKPVDPSNFYARVWIPTRKTAGLPELRVHDCRHHVASLLLSQGRSIKYTQTVMGHATVAVLLDVYTHLTPGEEGRATDDMERWLGEEEVAVYAA